MSNPHLEESEDDDEEDEEYCPKTQSSSSEEHSEDEDNVEQDKKTNRTTETSSTSLDAKPFDKDKTEELWKSFTSSTSTSNKTNTNETKITTNKVFEFAGEKVSIASTSNSTKRPASSVLDRLGLGKKQKLSTLEKSRLDWQDHKEKEALTEDLESHRRGKDSYVEKKAFLQRTELRQHDHYLSNIKKK